MSNNAFELILNGINSIREDLNSLQIRVENLEKKQKPRRKVELIIEEDDDISSIETSIEEETLSIASSVTFEMQPLPKKRLSNKIKKILTDDFEIVDEEKMRYSIDEIREMDETNLSIAWARIKPEYTLINCSHCKKPKHMIYFITEIRNCCLKDGLNKDTRVPKTCDHQQKVNRQRNKINNKVYPILRNPDAPEEQKQRYMYAKECAFDLMCIDIKESKYTYKM